MVNIIQGGGYLPGDLPPPSQSLLQLLGGPLSIDLKKLLADLNPPDFDNWNNLDVDLHNLVYDINSIYSSGLSPGDKQDMNALVQPIWSALNFKAPGLDFSLLTAIQSSNTGEFGDYMQYFKANQITAGAQFLYPLSQGWQMISYTLTNKSLPPELDPSTLSPDVRYYLATLKDDLSQFVDDFTLLEQDQGSPILQNKVCSDIVRMANEISTADFYLQGADKTTFNSIVGPITSMNNMTITSGGVTLSQAASEGFQSSDFQSFLSYFFNPANSLEVGENILGPIGALNSWMQQNINE